MSEWTLQAVPAGRSEEKFMSLLPTGLVSRQSIFSAR